MISFKSLLKIDHFRAIGKLFRITLPIFYGKKIKTHVSKIRFCEKMKKSVKKKEMRPKNYLIKISLNKKLPFYVNFDPI